MQLRAGPYELLLLPELGGAVGRFDWQGQPLFRPGSGPSPLDTGCFPLVPFSNLIGNGRFRFRGEEVAIPPNASALDTLNPLHGFGWLSAWTVVEASAQSATLEHRYKAADWPWDYRAVQRFDLDDSGLQITLSLTNRSHRPMPAGLGLHPYIPREADTRYLGLHRHEWRNDAAGLPVERLDAGRPFDWWEGQPVGARNVDTIFTRRRGPLRIVWPQRSMSLEIRPSRILPMTVVYVPEGQSHMCVEPVSHMTDSLSRRFGTGRMTVLAPDETLSARVRFRAHCQT